METVNQQVRKSLPEQGMSREAIDQHFSAIEIPEPYGHFARAFRPPSDVQEVGRRAFTRFMSDNGFFSLYLPYMQTIEQEVIAMGVSLLNPTETSTGNFTSGGTESNFSAMHAARNWARENGLECGRPNIVAPETIHPSFQKGARYLGMEVITTPLDENGRGIPDEIAAAINPKTVMLAGSAPSWHYANIDPIPEIAAIAQERGLWMHVDACVGGYISPFFEKLGEPITPWDFRVPGVKSISADLHKYGYCLKPASTIFWREADYQKYHYVAINDKFLGEYKLAGFSGSRSAGPIFAAWAVMNYLGEKGYLELAKRVLDLKARLTEGIEAIEGLKVWNTEVMPMHFHSVAASTPAIYQGLLDKGWLMLGLVEPQAVTVCVDGAMTDEILDLFLSDLREVTEALLSGGVSKEGDIRYS